MLKINNKIHFITAKQSQRTIAVTHAEQFSQHNNMIKSRGRQAAIHMLKHNFLIDIWHLMNRLYTIWRKQECIRALMPLFNQYCIKSSSKD